MSTSIRAYAADPGPDIYYDDDFRAVLETYLTLLRTDRNTQTRTVQSSDARAYKGDFFGLLQNDTINKEYHWIIMRMNGFVSPGDTDETLASYIYPDLSLIERIRGSYMKQNNLSY
jgi:hypothetical protein